MRKKLLIDISANAVQVIVNQICGLCIFYILSTQLEKKDFGELNWTLAVLLTLFGILSFGIEQIFIKKIASGHPQENILSVYIVHVLLSGTLSYGLLLLGKLFFVDFFSVHFLLLTIGVGKLMLFFSTPFKQLASGSEKFRSLLVMSVCSNIIRSVGLVIWAFFFSGNLKLVIIIFICGDVIELLLSIYITKAISRVPLHLKWDKMHYFKLIKESLPQFGVTLFAAMLSRFDWICLGLFSTNMILADYSFAYKVFEMATLPLLIIAPVLIPKFTRLFISPNNYNGNKLADIYFLLRIEMIIASLSALVLNICWIPVVEFITAGKYGISNQQSFFILSLSIPLIYYNNFMWTINFAKGALKMIFYTFVLIFIINAIMNIILIPNYKADGAALSYFAAMLVQALVFLFKTDVSNIKKNSMALLITPLCALISVYTAMKICNTTTQVLSLSLLLFFLLLAATGQLKRKDWLSMQRITGL